MRKRIFEIIERSGGDDRLSSVYDGLMMAVILISLFPLAFKENPPVFQVMDRACAAVFIADYGLRLLTADYKFGKHAASSFLRYPFSFMAVVDLLSILPSLTVLDSSLKLLRVTRMVRALRVFRAFKAVRYSKNISILYGVFRRSREPLLAVGALAVSYILLSALVIFNVEPDSFDNFFEAVYWATISLTTMGYGDIYPVTTVGRLVTMVSSMFGIAIVALPAGIVTAGYMKELEKDGQ